MESGGVRYIFTHALFLYDELSEFSLVQQLVRKYRTKHFPCGILFIYYIHIGTFIILPASKFKSFQNPN